MTHPYYSAFKHAPRKTPTPPNLARPWRYLFALSAFMLAVGCAAAWVMPKLFAAITAYVVISAN